MLLNQTDLITNEESNENGNTKHYNKYLEEIRQICYSLVDKANARQMDK